MSVLVLVLAGPLQAWGASSRFTTRSTERAPTKSGILGMLAAAQGKRRTDDLAELLDLRFGVRLDQPGEVLRDFQTSISLVSNESMPLSYRFYRADARYLAAVEGDQAVLEGLEESLIQPVFPLYLGRRSCPPSEPIGRGIRPGNIEDLFLNEPWHAASWWQRTVSDRERSAHVHVEYQVDSTSEGAPPVFPEKPAAHTMRDIPISFDPENRRYGWRNVWSGHLSIPNPTAPKQFQAGPSGHDPFQGVM